MRERESIALSFLATKVSDFRFDLYRKIIGSSEQSLPGSRWLPKNLSDAEKSEQARFQISFKPQEGFECVSVHAWTNIDLTIDVIHRALVERVTKEDLLACTKISPKTFVREVDFVLREHDQGIYEAMRVRAHALKSIGRIGFLLNFALRVPREAIIPQRRVLELSLTNKNGRVNGEYYLDRYQKIGEFIQKFYQKIKFLELHDGTLVELDSKLANVPSETLKTRTFVFGGGRQGKNQFFGLRDCSPYGKISSPVRLVFLFSPGERPLSQDLFKALRGDTFSTFTGMEKMFGYPIGRDNVSGLEISDFSHNTLTLACQRLKEEFNGQSVVPVVIVPFSKNSSDEETASYYIAKHAFLSAGMASQFVDRNRTMGDKNALKWSISNIALALFAKMGGVPWRILPSTEKCLIVGVGQAHKILDGVTQKYIAYSVMTDSSGMYETIKVLGSSSDKEEYLKSLKENLKQILISHGENYRSFVLHATYSLKKMEIDVIRESLLEININESSGSEFIAIKFNDRNDYFGFSRSHNSMTPFEGTTVQLSKKEFLIWFSGVSINDNKTPKKPEKPVHVKVLYPLENLPRDDVNRLLQDAVNIAGANWRGFNAKSMPISVYYSELIAKYYASFRQVGLPEIDMDNLPPWFL